jgi:hypothetical protein
LDPDGLRGFSVGDIVAFVDHRFTALQKFRIPYYVAIRRVTALGDGQLEVDRPFGDDFVGFAHNITTTDIPAEPVLDSEPRRRLSVWSDASFGNLTVDTQGYWIADSATMGVRFHDIEVRRARALHYGNTFQNSVFERVSGEFSIKSAELSHNCEDLLITDWEGRYRPAPSLDTSDIVSIQESSIGVTIQRGKLDVTGIRKGPVLRVMNGTGTYRDLDCTSTDGQFGGIVVALGDVFGQPNRRVSDGVTVERVNWSGDCMRFVNVSGTIRNFRVDTCTFSGAVRSGEAFRVRSASGAGVIANCDFQHGRGVVEPSGAHHQIRDNYVHDGLAVASVSTFANHNGYFATAGREALAIRQFSVPVPPGQETVLISKTLPAGAILPEDHISFSARFRMLSGNILLRIRPQNGQVQQVALLTTGQDPVVDVSVRRPITELGELHRASITDPVTIELVASHAKDMPPARIEELSFGLTNPTMR